MACRAHSFGFREVALLEQAGRQVDVAKMTVVAGPSRIAGPEGAASASRVLALLKRLPTEVA